MILTAVLEAIHPATPVSLLWGVVLAVAVAVVGEVLIKRVALTPPLSGLKATMEIEM
jgi:hypothetical protein